jgi:hypothetical protein
MVLYRFMIITYGLLRLLKDLFFNLLFFLYNLLDDLLFFHLQLPLVFEDLLFSFEIFSLGVC